MKNKGKRREVFIANDKFLSEGKVLESIPREEWDEISAEVAEKMYEVDLEKVLGYKVSDGQQIIILLYTLDRVKGFLDDMLITTYQLKSRNAKKTVQELVSSLFLKELFEEYQK
ncbi:MAG: hypothetical protein ABSF14_23765, partial [Terriglobia bacterium]